MGGNFAPASHLHPEFSFLPRKFKIALTAAAHDRAAVKVHDIGLRMHRNGAGETGFEVMVGGGLGRTPFIAKTIKPFLAKRDLLSYVEAIMRAYNQYGRRDNIYKARIKILVHELGADKFARDVEAEWLSIKDGELALDDAVVAEVASRFRYPAYEELADNPPELAEARATNARFRVWLDNSVANHKVTGHAIVMLSLKPVGGPPGDATAAQMDATADLADRYSHGEIRVAHCGARSMRSASPRPMSDLSPTSSPAPASTTAASPTRARSRSRKRSPSASRISIAPAALGGCISIFPAASTPAAITTSAISAFWESRRMVKNFIR